MKCPEELSITLIESALEIYFLPCLPVNMCRYGENDRKFIGELRGDNELRDNVRISEAFKVSCQPFVTFF